MRYIMFLALFLVCLQPAAKAQATLIPAGTLLHCTIDDPTISPKTAQVGDPVLCHLLVRVTSISSSITLACRIQTANWMRESWQRKGSTSISKATSWGMGMRSAMSWSG